MPSSLSATWVRWAGVGPEIRAGSRLWEGSTGKTDESAGLLPNRATIELDVSVIPSKQRDSLGYWFQLWKGAETQYTSTGEQLLAVYTALLPSF